MAEKAGPQPRGPGPPAPGAALRRLRGRPPKLTVDERRAAVLQAAIDAFAVDGPHAAGVGEVAERAGVGKAAVYDLFPSKDELFAGALQEANDRFSRALARARAESEDLELRARLRRRYASVFGFARDQPAAFRLLTHAWFERVDDPNGRSAARDRLIEQLGEALRREPGAAAVVRAGFDQALASVLAGVVGGGIGAVVDDPNLDVEGVIDLLTDFTVGGLMAVATGTASGPDPQPEHRAS